MRQETYTGTVRYYDLMKQKGEVHCPELEEPDLSFYEDGGERIMSRNGEIIGSRNHRPSHEPRTGETLLFWKGVDFKGVPIATHWGLLTEYCVAASKVQSAQS
ncbi:MAG: hypothetical protein V4644_00315 [Patescibacteria group bacterium]